MQSAIRVVVGSMLCSGSGQKCIEPSICLTPPRYCLLQCQLFLLHLTSPFPTTSNPGAYEADFLIPTINGTLQIYEAASKYPSIKRVVLASSFVSVYNAARGPNPGKTYTEDDLTPLTYEDGGNAPVTPVVYRVSKVLAERWLETF